MAIWFHGPKEPEGSDDDIFSKTTGELSQLSQSESLVRVRQANRSQSSSIVLSTSNGGQHVTCR